jgi:hypothetical protein
MGASRILPQDRAFSHIADVGEAPRRVVRPMGWPDRRALPDLAVALAIAGIFGAPAIGVIRAAIREPA